MDLRALTQDQLAISDFIRAEIERVLTQKFDPDPVELQVVLDELLAQALRIKVTGEVEGVCRDPKDDAILETASRAEADCLVAGDKDLLALSKYGRTAIIPPAEYLKYPYDE